MSAIGTEDLDDPLVGDYLLREQPDEEDDEDEEEDNGKKRDEDSKEDDDGYSVRFLLECDYSPFS